MSVDRRENPLRMIRRKLREVGPAYAAQRAFCRIVPAWLFRFNALVVVVVELDPGSRAPKRDPAIRWGSEADLLEVSRLGFALEKCHRWLDDGARFAVFEHEGRIEGCSWFQDGFQDYEGWLHFVSSETGTWSRATVISPRLRGQGAFPRILAYVYADLVRARITHVFAPIDALNRNSIRAGEKSGTRLLLRIFYVRILSLTVVGVGGRISAGLWRRGKPLEIDVEPFLPPASPI